MINVDVDINALADALAERLTPARSRWMNVPETAEYMRCSENWLRDQLQDIPHSKVAGKLLFDRVLVDEFITNHQRRR